MLQPHLVRRLPPPLRKQFLPQQEEQQHPQFLARPTHQLHPGRQSLQQLEAQQLPLFLVKQLPQLQEEQQHQLLLARPIHPLCQDRQCLQQLSRLLHQQFLDKLFLPPWQEHQLQPLLAKQMHQLDLFKRRLHQLQGPQLQQRQEQHSHQQLPVGKPPFQPPRWAQHFLHLLLERQPPLLLLGPFLPLTLEL